MDVQVLSRKALKKALTRGGMTGADLARKVGVTREAIRCRYKGSLRKARTAEWYANYYGHPEMANKEWLEAALRKAKGAAGLARQLGDLSYVKIRSQAERLGIDLALCSHYFYTEMVEVKCAFCHKKIEVLKSQIRRPGQAVLCNRRCFAGWMKEVVWPRRREVAKKARMEEMQRKLNGRRRAA